MESISDCTKRMGTGPRTWHLTRFPEGQKGKKLGEDVSQQMSMSGGRIGKRQDRQSRKRLWVWGIYFGRLLCGHESSMTGYWSHGRATQPVGALSGYHPTPPLRPTQPHMAAPHAPSLKTQHPSLEVHPNPTPLTQQAAKHGETLWGKSKGPSFLFWEPPTTGRKQSSWHSALSSPHSSLPRWHPWGLATLQLFLLSDFRNCRLILVTGHHSQRHSIHSNHKKPQPQRAAVHGHTHPSPRCTTPAMEPSAKASAGWRVGVAGVGSSLGAV